MMKIDIITLFPDMFKGPFDISMLLKAQERNLVKIEFHDLRTYGIGPRRTVDDTPYGGGDGMLLRPEPFFAAIEHIKAQSPFTDTQVVALTPAGQQYNQSVARQLSLAKHLILLAGHYEGFDERIMTLVDLQLSVGDYVLTGGELAAMVVVDSVVRLIPGVLGGQASAADDSFSAGLLEYPQYTRPAEFQGLSVPDTLRHGNHAEIAQWRADQSMQKTRINRPDLLS